jgi:hypothetical protein
VDGLGFDDLDLGVITIAAAVFAWLALYVYRSYFFDMNWQYLYYGTTLLNAVLSGLQLLLVYGDTGGLPKLLFAVRGLRFIDSSSSFAVFHPRDSFTIDYFFSF